MDKVSGRLTVFFEEPFWIGVFERISEGKLSVCKVTFGAEPKERIIDVSGIPGDTTLVCVVTPCDSTRPVDRETLVRWLRVRTRVDNVKLFVEP